MWLGCDWLAKAHDNVAGAYQPHMKHDDAAGAHQLPGNVLASSCCGHLFRSVDNGAACRGGKVHSVHLSTRTSVPCVKYVYVIRPFWVHPPSWQRFACC
eukprot:274357-Chlamydomonas_euryale.AAC.6